MSNELLTGSAITIGIFLISHLSLAIWFASKMSSKVSDMTDTIKDMAGELKSLASLDKRIAILEDRMSRAELDAREALKAAALLSRQMPSSERGAERS